MSSQVTLGSNWELTQVLKPVGELAPGTAFSRLPKVSGRPPTAVVLTHRGWEAMSRPRRSLAQLVGSPSIALRVSRWRAPMTARSTVRTSTGEPTALARAIRSSA